MVGSRFLRSDLRSTQRPRSDSSRVSAAPNNLTPFAKRVWTRWRHIRIRKTRERSHCRTIRLPCRAPPGLFPRRGQPHPKREHQVNSSMNSRHIGIDVGQNCLFGAVIETDPRSASISFSPETDPTVVLDWCAASGPDSVAIDAPPAHSKGLARVGIRRVAEERLGIGGCYGTPCWGSPLPPWMAAGMRCHEVVSAALREPSVDLTGIGRVFEVHPTYGFRSLLGVHEDADRVKCDPDALLRPKAPRGSTGHVQRVEILRVLLEWFGVTWTPTVSDKLLSRIDWTDAAMSAALAVLRARSATQGVGDATEGTIVIANPAELGVIHRRIRDAVSELCPSRQPTARPTTRSKTRPHDTDCALLRLGTAGLGVLSQGDTLAALGGQHSEGEISLPVGVIAIGRQWIERAATSGFWLLVSYGRLKLALHVVEIIGKGRAELTPKEMVLGANRDPWRTVEQSEYWLRCDELLDDLDLPLTVVSTRQERSWTAGVPRNQSAWLAARINDGPFRKRLRGL